MRNKNFHRSIACAQEFYRLSMDGRVTDAEQVRRSIESLVGYWDEGVFRIPKYIQHVMRNGKLPPSL